MADLATLKAWLDEAEKAYHSLNIGERVVKIVRNGTETNYTQANKSDLKAYMTDLKTQIAVLEGTSRRAPVVFNL